MALVRTRNGWQDDSQAASIDWGVPEAAARERENRERGIQVQQEGMTSNEVQGLQRDVARKAFGAAQNESAQNVAATQADAQVRAAQAAAQAQIEAARIRARGGYAAGGPVNKPDPRASRRGYAKGGPIF